MSSFEINDLIKDLMLKSEKAYLMALEIINKPTIKYRTEGFSFFICNAWELMLKAFLIKRENSIEAIMFRGTNRSISLSNCVEKVFTSTTDKTKANLNFIISVRNKSTHLILSEFDYSLAPFFQQNVTNYIKFASTHFEELNINESINPYISIHNVKKADPNALILFDEVESIKKLINDTKDKDGYTQNVQIFITKKRDEADMTMAKTQNLLK